MIVILLIALVILPNVFAALVNAPNAFANYFNATRRIEEEEYIPDGR